MMRRKRAMLIKEEITVNDEEEKGLNEVMEQKMVKNLYSIISFSEILNIFLSKYFEIKFVVVVHFVTYFISCMR